ncbi:MAG: hypothetical protein LIP77_10015, partial [Planctomycetes bacterium]|nr:hypothetical protein [Planctomycetota bacterium]
RVPRHHGRTETGRGGAVELKWESSDPNFGPTPVKIQYAVNARGPRDRDAIWDTVQENLSAAGSLSWTPPTDQTATYNFRLIAEDRAGNYLVAYNPATIAIDRTPPNIVGVSPLRSNSLENDILIEADDGPSGSGVKEMSLYTSGNGGGTWTLVKETTDTGDSVPVKRRPGETIPFTAPASGDYALWPVVFDEAGNATPLPGVGAPGPYILTIDTEPPSVSLSDSFLQGRGAVLTNETRYVSWTAYDTHLLENSAIISISLDNGATWQELRSGLPANGSEVISFPFGSQSEEARLKVSVADEFGNVGEDESVAFKLSNAATAIEAVTAAPSGGSGGWEPAPVPAGSGGWGTFPDETGTPPVIAPPEQPAVAVPTPVPSPVTGAPSFSGQPPFLPPTPATDPYAAPPSAAWDSPYPGSVPQAGYTPQPDYAPPTEYTTPGYAPPVQAYPPVVGGMEYGGGSGFSFDDSMASSIPNAMTGGVRTGPPLGGTDQSGAGSEWTPSPQPAAAGPGAGSEWYPAEQSGPSLGAPLPPPTGGVPSPSGGMPPPTGAMPPPAGGFAFDADPVSPWDDAPAIVPPPAWDTGGSSAATPPAGGGSGAFPGFEGLGGGMEPPPLPPAGGPIPSTDAGLAGLGMPGEPLPPPAEVAAASGMGQPPAPASGLRPPGMTGSAAGAPDSERGLPTLPGSGSGLDVPPPITPSAPEARPANPRDLSNHYVGESRAYQNEGRTAEAMRSATDAINADGSNPAAYMQLSQLNARNIPPDYVRAATLAKAATELSRDWEVWWNCAEVYYIWAHAKNREVQAMHRNGQRPPEQLLDERNQTLSNARVAINNAALQGQQADGEARKKIANTPGLIAYLGAMTVPEPVNPGETTGPAADQFRREMQTYKATVAPMLFDALPYFQEATRLGGSPTYSETFHQGMINYRLGNMERETANMAQATTFYQEAARFLEEATTSRDVPSDGPREAYYMLAHCFDLISRQPDVDSNRYRELALRYWRATVEFYAPGSPYRDFAEQRIEALTGEMGL